MRTVDYDPITHLNQMFTEPPHLASVASACTMLQQYSRELDDEIVELVKRQDASNTQSIQRIQAAKTDMAELFQKIEDVRERAVKTEETITEMTSEIKQLDNAKRNLTLSMTALKRLQMLTTAYEQLSAMSKARQYGECAQLLQAVLQLMAHFKTYRSVDQIALLSRNVSDIQQELIEQICEDFELAFAKGELHQKKGTLAEGCQVVEVLGESAKSRLINWYCNSQLREYRQVFRGSEEAGSLDNMSRRYAWLKRLLKTYDEEHATIFPASWKVNSILTNAFCEGTREDFKGILSRSTKSGQTLDVSQLLSCLQETLDFEHFLDKKLVGPSRTSMDAYASSQDQPVYNQSISEAFVPYLSLWIEDQDKQLALLMRQYKQTPLKPPDEEFNPQLVISSSTELFTFYRHSLAQCAKLSTGNSLAELFKVFAKYLDQYAQQILLAYILERANNPTIALEDIVMVINTADYCYTTTNQLEEKIKSRIDEAYKSKIDLQNQADAFMGIASSGVRLLVRSVEISLEPAWREMRNMPWSKLDTVGDNSSYVVLLLDNIKGRSEQILQILHKQQYARAFADHLVEGVSTFFLSNVFQCRPVSEVAAEQMLLDAYTLKTGMSEIISPPPTSYTRRLNSSFQKVDNLLKVLQVRPSPPETLVQAYLLHIADKNEGNFRRILDMKGIRSKTEQNQLIELFSLHRASSRYATSLQASNPIIALLQNPNPNTPASTATASNSASTSQGILSGAGSSFPNLSSAIVSGVERFGSPVLGTSSASQPGGGGGGMTPARTSIENNISATLGLQSGGGGAGGGGSATPSSSAGNLNENLKSIGKFFRRDLGGLSGRFGGRAGEESGSR